MPRTLKLGLSAPFEGLYRDLGYEALYAVRLAVRQRNEAHDPAGLFKVELVALNDYNEPGEAARQAKELAADPGVLAVVGGLSIETAEAASPEYERLGLPFVTPAADPARLGEEAARVAASELGASNAGVLEGDSASDRSIVQSFMAAFSARGGSIVLEVTLAEDADLASALRGSPQVPDVLFIAADSSRCAEAISSARQAGFRGAIVGGPEMGSPLVVAIAGGASDGVIFVSPYLPAPEDPAFSRDYTALSGGAPPGPVGAWAYAAATRLLDALDAASRSGRPTRSAIGALLSRSGVDSGHISVYEIRGSSVYNPR